MLPSKRLLCLCLNRDLVCHRCFQEDLVHLVSVVLRPFEGALQLVEDVLQLVEEILQLLVYVLHRRSPVMLQPQ